MNRILKLCFPLAGLFAILSAAVYYTDWSNGMGKMVWPGNISLRGILTVKETPPMIRAYNASLSSTLNLTETTSDHPCDRLLRNVNFNGSHEKTIVLEEGGCPLNHFTGSAVLQCMQETNSTHVMFIGDSRVRQLYEGFRQKLIHSTNAVMEKYHTDKHTRTKRFTAEFLWKIRAHELKKTFTNILRSPKKPDILIVGVGVHDAVKTFDETWGLEPFEQTLRNSMLPLAELRAKHCDVLWIPQDPVKENMKNKKGDEIPPKLIDGYNSIAYNIMSKYNVPIWKSSRLTADHFPSHHTDGIHYGPIVHKYKIQILDSWLCNRKKEKRRCCA